MRISIAGRNLVAAGTIRWELSGIKSLVLIAVLAVGVIVCPANLLRAQAPDRIAGAIDSTNVVVLPGHHPQWANAGNSLHPLGASQTVEGLTLVLSRSPERELALQQLLVAQLDPASPLFHHWLTPARLGEEFGLSGHDMETISAWLQSQGLQVTFVAPSRVFIGFSGTAAQLNRVFHTELQIFKVRGAERMSVASDPKLPVSLATVVKAIRGLYSIDDHPLHAARSMRRASPDLTLANGDHFISPQDFATLYDAASNDGGPGQTIGIVGVSRTDFADFTQFRTLTGSEFTNPIEIVPTAFGGVDPGPAYTSPPSTGTSIGGQSEATLDVLRAGSIAWGSKIKLVVATAASGGYRSRRAIPGADYALAGAGDEYQFWRMRAGWRSLRCEFLGPVISAGRWRGYFRFRFLGRRGRIRV